MKYKVTLGCRLSLARVCIKLITSLDTWNCNWIITLYQEYTTYIVYYVKTFNFLSKRALISRSWFYPFWPWWFDNISWTRSTRCLSYFASSQLRTSAEIRAELCLPPGTVRNRYLQNIRGRNNTYCRYGCLVERKTTENSCSWNTLCKVTHTNHLF